MAVSTFDPNVFLSQEVKGASETKYTPVPEGEYDAYVDSIGADEYEGQRILIVNWAIMDEGVKKALGLEKPTIQDRIFLEYENGVLAFGTNKNVKLGRLREAAGLNDAKKTFNFNMLNGVGPVRLMVAHVPGKGENASEKFPRVTRYAKAPK